jgi:hypothetical protein
LTKSIGQTAVAPAAPANGHGAEEKTIGTFKHLKGTFIDNNFSFPLSFGINGYLLNDVLTDFDSYFFKILKLEMHNFIVLF